MQRRGDGKGLQGSRLYRYFCDGSQLGRQYGCKQKASLEKILKEHGLKLENVSPAWMLAHPELWDASIEEQFALVHAGGGLVIHAHPFREEYYIPQIRLFPAHVDGVEGINATHSNSRSLSHNDRTFDDRAVAYAREHGLVMTAGSDIHTTRLLGGGMAFRRKLKDGEDFVSAVRNQEDYILTNGEDWFDSRGERLFIV